MVEFEVLPSAEGKKSPLILDNIDLLNSLSITKINGSITVLPSKSILLQNYPNPFNPETWIPFQLAQDADVIIDIYDAKAGVYITKDKAGYWNGINDAGEKATRVR